MKKLLKFYGEDDEGFGYIIADNSVVNDIIRILERYRMEEEYNWDDFIKILKVRNIEFETFKIEKIYF